LLEEARAEGYAVATDNHAAVRHASIVVIAMQPQQLEDLLHEIRNDLVPSTHLLISLVSGMSIAEIQRHLGFPGSVVRAMPNTAIAIRESMTCLSSNRATGDALAIATALFESVGATLIIPMEHMIPATALCACGIAFFLRSGRHGQLGDDHGHHDVGRQGRAPLRAARLRGPQSDPGLRTPDPGFRNHIFIAPRSAQCYCSASTS
jgi:pyrroline-5-carboxylate reductase